jgi:hypothetical protein
LQAWASLSWWRLLSILGNWLSSYLAWVNASSTSLSSVSRASLFTNRSEIFYFNSPPEDCKVPILLCFSSAACFTCKISSLSRA